MRHCFADAGDILDPGMLMDAIPRMRKGPVHHGHEKAVVGGYLKAGKPCIEFLGKQERILFAGYYMSRCPEMVIPLFTEGISHGFTDRRFASAVSKRSIRAFDNALE